MAKGKKIALEKDYEVLVRPLVTEKTSLVGEMGSCVTFEVSPRASKSAISDAVERIYDVEVNKVRTMNLLGKTRRRGKSLGRTRSYKKAYVTLAPGHTIDVVDGL